MLLKPFLACSVILVFSGTRPVGILEQARAYPYILSMRLPMHFDITEGITQYVLLNLTYLLYYIYSLATYCLAKGPASLPSIYYYILLNLTYLPLACLCY